MGRARTHTHTHTHALLANSVGALTIHSLNRTIHILQSASSAAAQSFINEIKEVASSFVLLLMLLTGSHTDTRYTNTQPRARAGRLCL